jgi:hypothetical protein
MMMSLRQLTFGLYCTAGLLFVPAVARAQFTATPFSDPATGERYHIEASFGWWSAAPDFQIASESLGVIGTVIDAIADLGIEQKQIPELRIVLRPGRKHKVRVDYLPMS